MTEKQKKFRRDKESKIVSIIETTVRLIEEKGYSGFSVDDIPTHANLSIGTVYRYFPKGKSDILHEIITRNNKALIDMIPKEEVSEGNLYDFWRGVIVAYLRGHREGRFRLSAMEFSSGTDPQFSEILRPFVIDFLQQLTNRIVNLQMFEEYSKKEILEKVVLAFGIVGMLIKGSVRQPFFSSDERLVDYLIEVSKLTFEFEL